MSNSIKLSKKHGVNPTICKCFFCGNDKGIALLGQIGDMRKGEDFEAPPCVVMDYDPCDECQENMNKGVTLIGVTEVQPSDNRPAMKAQGDMKVYPTGRWCVIKPEAFSRVFHQTKEAGHKVFVESQLLDNLMGGTQS